MPLLDLFYNKNMIDKDCYLKRTEYKFFGITIFEKKEIFDNSMFQKEDESVFYSVPKCFQEVKK